jgi:hypothetical protein
MLVVVLAAASVYGITSFQNQVTVTVHEPVTWTPTVTNVDAWVGQSNSYTVQICNLAAFPITVKFSALVSPPTGGSMTDIVLNATVRGVTSPVTPAITIPLAPGSGSFDPSNSGVCLNVQVNFLVAPSAQKGTYAIANTVTKA